MNLPFEHTLAALARIWDGDGARKHGDDEWVSREDCKDMDAFYRHMLKTTDPEAFPVDSGSGEQHLEHAILRLMCVNERKRRRIE